MKKIKKIFTLCVLSGLMSACGLLDKDNTPPPASLTTFKPEIAVQSVWYTGTGLGGSGKNVKLGAALSSNTVFTAHQDGTVVATDKATGKNRWKAYSGHRISAGPEAADGMVFVASPTGDITALNQINGEVLWHNHVATEILASPAARNGVVLAKSIDGKVTGFAENDGHVLWTYQEAEPTLILRGASKPQIQNNNAVVGFANGSLAKLTLPRGNLLWKQIIAVPEGIFLPQRMVDIDADPVIAGSRVYAATYQGKIAAIDMASGRTIWNNDTSSYAGIAADENAVYVSDAKSHITAFDADSGASSWRQTKLDARNITGPAIVGSYILVGDELGYLHWLSKQDGRFVARIRVGGSGVVATPIVENNIVYVVTRDGHLAAYKIS